MIKRIIKFVGLLPQLVILKVFFWLETALSILSSSAYSFEGRERFIARIDSEKRKVRHKNLNGDLVTFSLHTPNIMCLFRQSTFSSREPATLEWIDRFGGKGALFDIGANIGIYSIYYAISQPGRVYAFEPSIFNLRQLGNNVNANNLADKITIVPNPLSKKSCSDVFINSNIVEGGALNSFGVNFGHDGKELVSSTKYSVIGFSLDDLLKYNILPELPAMVKIDVDGTEHIILDGAQKTIRSKECKSILLEVNDNFLEQASAVSSLLSEAGFILTQKARHAKRVTSKNRYNETYHQIWVKSEEVKTG